MGRPFCSSSAIPLALKSSAPSSSTPTPLGRLAIVHNAAAASRDIDGSSTKAATLSLSRASELQRESETLASEAIPESMLCGTVIGFQSDGRAVVRLDVSEEAGTETSSSGDVIAGGKLLMRGLRVQLQAVGATIAGAQNDLGTINSCPIWTASPIPGKRQKRPKNKCIHPTRPGGLCRDCPRRKGRSF